MTLQVVQVRILVGDSLGSHAGPAAHPVTLAKFLDFSVHRILHLYNQANF